MPYEHSILVTDTTFDLSEIFYHYRDFADRENNFDELEESVGMMWIFDQRHSQQQDVGPNGSAR